MSAATPVALRGDIDCPPCGGSGMVALPPRPDGLLDERECSACRGTGRIVPATYATTSPPGAPAPGDAARDREEALRSAVARWYAEEDADR